MQIFKLYRERGSLLAVTTELNRRGRETKTYTTKAGKRIEYRIVDEQAQDISFDYLRRVKYVR